MIKNVRCTTEWATRLNKAVAEADFKADSPEISEILVIFSGTSLGIFSEDSVVDAAEVVLQHIGLIVGVGIEGRDEEQARGLVLVTEHAPCWDGHPGMECDLS